MDHNHRNVKSANHCFHPVYGGFNKSLVLMGQTCL